MRLSARCAKLFQIFLILILLLILNLAWSEFPSPSGATGVEQTLTMRCPSDSPDAEFGTGASTAPSPGTAAVNEEVEVPQEDLAPSPSPGLLAVPEVEIRDDDVAAETMEVRRSSFAHCMRARRGTHCVMPLK